MLHSNLEISEELLRQYGGARICGNKEEIRQTILDWYGRFGAAGALEPNINHELVASFDAPCRAAELADLLAASTSAVRGPSNHMSRVGCISGIPLPGDLQ